MVPRGEVASVQVQSRRRKDSQRRDAACLAWWGKWEMELDTTSCCPQIERQCAVSWLFPGSKCPDLSYSAAKVPPFFSPYQAVWITCSLCATSHRCCSNWYAAPTGASPEPCQNAKTEFGIKAQRSTAEVFRGITSASAVFHSRQGNNAFKFLCPHCFWHQKHWLQTFSQYA